MSIEKWLKKNCTVLDGKTVAISGSTGGLGVQLCHHIARLGASLILIDRNRKKSEALGQKLVTLFPTLSISYITADMEDIESVKLAKDALLQTKVDYLILNAGAYSIPRKKCSTGYDNVFQINFISPYYLASSLMPKISEAGGRVIVVGSIAHNYSKTDTEDIDFSTRKKASLVYGNAKRYLMYALAEKYGKSGNLAITHPGITFTNITSHYPKIIFALIKHPMKVIFMSPKKAALSILKGIYTPTSKEEWIGPRLFNVWGMPKKKRLSTADEAERGRIYKIAEDIFSSI